MENLFAYGSLNDREVQENIFGRVLTGTPDILVGYVVKKIEIEEEFGLVSYPIITATENPDDIINGFRYELSEILIQQADNYEGIHYKRLKVELQSKNLAWTYTAVV